MKKFLLILVIAFKGVVKTFKRNPVVAIFCIIFLFPIMVNVLSHYIYLNAVLVADYREILGAVDPFNE